MRPACSGRAQPPPSYGHYASPRFLSSPIPQSPLPYCRNIFRSCLHSRESNNPPFPGASQALVLFQRRVQIPPRFRTNKNQAACPLLSLLQIPHSLPHPSRATALLPRKKPSSTGFPNRPPGRSQASLRGGLAPPHRCYLLPCIHAILLMEGHVDWFYNCFMQPYFFTYGQAKFWFGKCPHPFLRAFRYSSLYFLSAWL